MMSKDLGLVRNFGILSLKQKKCNGNSQSLIELNQILTSKLVNKLVNKLVRIQVNLNSKNKYD